MNGFGNFLKELRASSEFAGDSGAKKLAEILGCSRATIYNWERRKSPPTMLNRELFCKAFNLEDCKLEPSNFTGADSALLFLRGAVNARLVAALSEYDADQSGDSDAKEAAKFVALVFAKISTSNR